MGKLLKHEFYQTGRILLWLLAIGVVVGGIGTLLTMGENIGLGQAFIANLWNLLLLIGGIVVVVLGVIFLMVSNNRSLFSERGYLTFALPVSSTKLLASKFIVNVAFTLVNVALAAGLIIVAVVNAVRLVLNLDEFLTGQMFGDAGAEFDELGIEQGDGILQALFGFPSWGEVAVFLAWALVIAVVVFILAMMIVLFTLTVSHVRPFSNSPGLWTFLFLIGSAAVAVLLTVFISRAISVTVHLDFFMGAEAGGLSLNLVAGVVMLAQAAGFFFLTDYLLRRKISLK